MTLNEAVSVVLLSRRATEEDLDTACNALSVLRHDPDPFVSEKAITYHQLALFEILKNACFRYLDSAQSSEDLDRLVAVMVRTGAVNLPSGTDSF